MKKIIFASMAFMLMFFAACSSDNQIFPEEMPTVETPSDPAEDENEGEVVVPTQLYSISDIQTVSYCRGYLSGTARTSHTTVVISHLHDLSYLKSIDFKPQQRQITAALIYIIRCKYTGF